MNQNTVAKLFNTRDKVINDGLLTHLETFSTLMKVPYTYVTNQTLYLLIFINK